PSFSRAFISPAPTEIASLSLHDALPIFARALRGQQLLRLGVDPVGLGPRLLLGVGDDRPRRQAELDRASLLRGGGADRADVLLEDRKSTRLNSSHVKISYAVFCLKKKKD